MFLCKSKNQTKLLAHCCFYAGWAPFFWDHFYKCVATFCGYRQDELLIRKERRNYRKRRHKATVTRGGLVSSGGAPNHPSSSSSAAGAPMAASSAASAAVGASASASLSARGLPAGACLSDAPSVGSSEDEGGSAVAASQSDADEAESDAEKQGPFAFRRKMHCNYLAVSFYPGPSFCFVFPPTSANRCNPSF